MNPHIDLFQKRSSETQTLQLPKQTIWSLHNKKIFKTCSLIVVPMLAFTITMLSLVLANRIDLDECPTSDLCSIVSSKKSRNAMAYYTTVPVGRLAFVSSLSATIAGVLVAAQMTLFSYVMAARLLHTNTTSSSRQTRPNSYATSLVIRFLNAEVPLLWDLACRNVASLASNRTPKKHHAAVRLSLFVFLTSLVCSIFIQGANTYFHVVIQATPIMRRSIEPQQEFFYSRALAPWCYDAGNTYGTMANKNFWSCALEYREPSDPDLAILSLTTAKLARQQDISRDYQSYMTNFTDTQDITYAIIKAPDTNASVDWKGQSFAVSTSCQAIAPALCIWDQNAAWRNSGNAFYPFNCSSAHAGLVGNFTQHVHWTRFEDFHEYLEESPPFTNFLFSSVDPFTKMDQQVIPKITADEVNTVFKNPFTFVSQISVATKDEGGWPDAIEKSDLIWKRQNDSTTAAKFLYSCRSKVWDVQYIMIDGEVESLIPTLSNGTVTGIVSTMGTSFGGVFVGLLTKVFGEVNRDRNNHTPAQFQKNYELEISKALISNLIAHSIAVPVDLAQLRRNEVNTRLPASALWLLVTGNVLFVLLAIAIAVCAVKSASFEVQQAQLRLSSAGLAAQLFSPETAQRAATDDFDLFHRAGTDEDDSEMESTVEIRGSVLAGAEFFVHSVGQESVNGQTTQNALTDQLRKHCMVDQPVQRLLNRRTL